jgi:hypothetical protein
LFRGLVGSEMCIRDRGYSTVEKNKDLIHRHNDPALAQFIPQMHVIRARHSLRYKVPTYNVVIDARKSSLAQVQKIESNLLILNGTTAEFTLLAPWHLLQNRYSPINDELSDMREIFNWFKGDRKYQLLSIDESAELTIDQILTCFTASATPYYLFTEGTFDLNLKDLVDHLLASGNGIVGVANKDDRRAFALFAPALARGSRTKGRLYANIAAQFGLKWMTEENFERINQGKHNRLLRFFRYLKREGKKINSPRQLIIFITKVAALFMRKALRRG